MEKTKKPFVRKVLKVLMWAFLVIVVAYFVLVGFRVKHFVDLDKINAQIKKIHATTLTLDDVMGKNLPADPGLEVDKTVQGIDANNNGIRDDVELAIFKEYPNSAKTRAVLLQYAMALQMEVIQPVLEEKIVGVIVNNQDRAYFCMASIIPGEDQESRVLIAIEKYNKFIFNKEINTEQRKKAHADFFDKLKSGSLGESQCDIDLKTLPN